jgi:predicted NUDIX family NTP pyrophosphohydrolase
VSAARVLRGSAGLLLYRLREGALEVLLVHPGGPLWARRDEGAWSIPKGEHQPGEDSLAAARREFAEELGQSPPDTAAQDLGEVRLRSGKRIRAFALAGDLDASAIASNTCEIEWPPRSGRRIEIPEVDRAEWFVPDEARRRLNPAQAPLIDRLERELA